jgi:hypothetical protein
MAACIGEAVGQQCVAVRIPDAIRALAEEREIRRYGDPGWTGIR